MQNDTEKSRVLDLESSIFSDAQDLNFRLETHVFSKANFQTARRAMVYDIKEKGIPIA